MDLKKIDYAINISLKNRYIYVETPKVACSSVKDLLIRIEYIDTPYKRNFDVHDRQRSPLVQLSQLPKHEGEGILADPTWFRFAFVRNPFSRALSGYLDKVVRNREEKRPLLNALGRNESPIETELSFVDYLKAIQLIDPRNLDSHFRPQFQILLCRDISFQYIGAFESLLEDIEYLKERLGVSATLTFESVGSHATDANLLLDEYYSSEAIALVRKIYFVDFKYFGYQKPITQVAAPPSRRSWAIGEINAA